MEVYFAHLLDCTGFIHAITSLVASDKFLIYKSNKIHSHPLSIAHWWPNFC